MTYEMRRLPIPAGRQGKLEEIAELHGKSSSHVAREGFGLIAMAYGQIDQGGAIWSVDAKKVRHRIILPDLASSDLRDSGDAIEVTETFYGDVKALADAQMKPIDAITDEMIELIELAYQTVDEHGFIGMSDREGNLFQVNFNLPPELLF